MNPAEMQLAFAAIYAVLLACALECGFRLKRPFLYGFVTNLAVVFTQMMLIYAFAVHPHIATAGSDALKCGYAGPIVFVYPVLLFAAMFFHRTRAGQYIIVAAVALSVFAVNNLYGAVDGKNYIFGNEAEAFSKTICGGVIPHMMTALEETKAKLPATSEAMLKKYPDMVFDASSEIYLLMNRATGFVEGFESRVIKAVPTKYVELTNIYEVRQVPHRYYTRGGTLKDTVIYCDDVSSADVEAAMNKAREQMKTGR